MIFVVWTIFMVGAETAALIHEHRQEQRHSQSWDQENLKRNDRGCPTAVYIAPHGVLEQCP